MHSQHRSAPLVMALVVALLLFTALGCGGEKADPFDAATIRQDFEKRPIGELYADAEQQPWSPPEDRRLTDEQVVDFLKVAPLAERIVEVAGERLEVEMEIATRHDDDFTRLSSAFSAIGSMRSAATAHLRASLMLGMNPNRHQWVTDQILAASRIAAQRRTYADAVSKAENVRDTEVNPVLREQNEAAAHAARTTLEHWEAGMGDVQLANARKVTEHADELARFVPALRRR